MSLLDVLVNKGKVSIDTFGTISNRSKSENITLEEAAVKQGVSIDDILEAKSEFFGIPGRKIDSGKVNMKVLELIPEESVRYYKFVPLALENGQLAVGILEGDNVVTRDALNFISSKLGIPFQLYVITKNDFDQVVAQYKSAAGVLSKAVGQVEHQETASLPAQTLGGTSSVPSSTGAVPKKEDETFVEEENDLNVETGDLSNIESAPVTKIVAIILRSAIDSRASDIHMEPGENNLRVRTRIDGVLNTVIILPGKLQSSIIARIKIMSNMRLDEKRKPQDGRFSAKLENRKVDFRVSTFPIVHGEKVVMRILDTAKGIKKLGELGLSAFNLQKITSALDRPYGMILISGPTGSGKSTTLYSMLNEVDKEHENVLSLEDPVEYQMAGVSQSQMKPEIGYTFAAGLRTTLRQDPDTIMVGEIRDKETAQLAIQAALTGHLVLSTIHTNNAIGVVPRLIDMGVDPYLIAPTLICAIAQRLAKALCPGAGTPMPVDDSIKAMLAKQFEDLPEQYKNDLKFGTELYRLAPGPNCPTGVQGRIPVMEVLDVDKQVEQAILKNPTEAEIWKIARSKGMTTIKEDAILKAFNRTIPFEEINMF